MKVYNVINALIRHYGLFSNITPAEVNNFLEFNDFYQTEVNYLRTRIIRLENEILGLIGQRDTYRDR